MRRFATPTFREAACCTSTPPDAFTVTDRRFSSNAGRWFVAERRREFPNRAKSACHFRSSARARIAGPLHFTVIWRVVFIEFPLVKKASN